MEYKNKKTGKRIDVKSVLGGDWEPVKAKKKEEPANTEEKTQKGKAKK